MNCFNRGLPVLNMQMKPTEVLIIKKDIQIIGQKNDLDNLSLWDFQQGLVKDQNGYE